ncbi:MAG: hypothetical protein KJ634_00535 [Gammaproteobacteria bacterium]|nr:hypothetical protein [Gammaproteobacteria bacterium]MBU1414086.1 hypothetical protein [Gammaproteobacteria bacterium]
MSALIKKFFIFFLICLPTSVFAGSFVITIDKIVAGKQITGHIQGLAPQAASKYKVLVYVHTDRWYIHPYAGQGEERTWASVKEDGSWQVQTVQREFRADSVAALLVLRSVPEPNRVESLTNIPYQAAITKVLQGTPDYGKL